jgi:hypothetical protein
MLVPAVLSGGDPAWAEGSSSTGYGLGVFLSGSPRHRVEKHSGGWLDASAQLTRFLDDDVTVVVLANCGGWEERPWIGEELGTYFVKGFALPDWKPVTDPEPSFLLQVSSLMRNVVEKKPVMAPVAESLAKRIAKGPDAFSARFSPADIALAQFVQRVPQGKNAIYVYRLPGQAHRMLSVLRNKRGEIVYVDTYLVPR